MSGHVLPLPGVCLACDAAAVPGETCPATITCPHCRAKPGHRCRHPNGHAASMHSLRRVEADRIDRERRERQ